MLLADTTRAVQTEKGRTSHHDKTCGMGAQDHVGTDQHFCIGGFCQSLFCLTVHAHEDGHLLFCVGKLHFRPGNTDEQVRKDIENASRTG